MGSESDGNGLAALIGVLSGTIVILLVILIYIKYRSRETRRLSRESSDLSLRKVQRTRTLSIFSRSGSLSVYENGSAPDFDIPLIRKTASDSPKSTCQLHFSFFYNFQEKQLTVQVIQAQNLPKLFGLQSGVLVKVSLLDVKGELKEELGKTSIFFRKNSVFNTVLTSNDIDIPELRESSVNLTLHSQDHLGQSHFVGGVLMKFSEVQLNPSEPVYFWRPLQRKSNGGLPKFDRDKGQLFLSLRYHESTSRINVVVMKAAKLLKPKHHLRIDPYVIVKFQREGKVLQKKHTQPCKGTLDPVWNEPFVFDWSEDTSKDGFEFVFEIKLALPLIPDTAVGVVHISQNTSEHWKEMMSKKNYARAMCHNIT